MSNARIAHRCASAGLLAGSLLLALTSPAMSQEKYRQPPADIVKILDAPLTPGDLYTPT